MMCQLSNMVEVPSYLHTKKNIKYKKIIFILNNKNVYNISTYYVICLKLI